MAWTKTTRFATFSAHFLASDERSCCWSQQMEAGGWWKKSATSEDKAKVVLGKLLEVATGSVDAESDEAECALSWLLLPVLHER